MGLGPLCASLTPRSIEDVFSSDITGADCVEVRLDYLKNPADAASVRWDRLAVPVIATCRGKERGGLFPGTLDEEVHILQDAVRNGARFVDIDYRFLKPFPGAGVIASFHDFRETPGNIGSTLDAACKTGAELAKVATLVRTWEDNRRLLGLLDRKWSKPVIVVGMGETGQITRVLGPARGSTMTYASCGDAAAPGQLSLPDMSELYRVRQIGRDTTVLGIIGKPLGHSLSPLVHNRAFQALGLDFVYLRFATDSLGDFFEHAAALGIRGFSVTLPYKTMVMKFLEMVTSDARAVGAVNTVYRKNEKWIGENTDVCGVDTALKTAGVDSRGKRVVILGAGGAARAAVAALSNAEQVVLLARRPESVTGFPPGIRVGRIEDLQQHSCDLLINCTPVGMAPESGATPVSGPLPGNYVFDMIYNPPVTRLLQLAQEQGKTAIGGMTMFLAQAARQFELWTGHPVQPHFGDWLLL